MKQPKPRTSRQSKQARKVLANENMLKICIRVDADLRQQFFLIAQFKELSMTQILNDHIEKYVKRHYGKVVKGCDKLSKRAERRNR